MRVDLHAKVRTRDGQHAGHVEAAVLDPHTNRVKDVVVSTGGFLGKDVLVPVGEIERAQADGDAVRLELSKQELEQLPAYVSLDYVPPPAGWTMPTLPATYAFPTGGLLWPAGYVPTATLPTAAQVPPPGAAGTDTFSDRRADEAEIEKGALVLDGGGNDVGVVDDVRFDEVTGTLGGFVVRLGGPFRTFFGGGETTELSAEDVESVAAGVVHLRHRIAQHAR
jgi:sporulation protein YlmC with PRC-barrel domain